MSNFKIKEETKLERMLNNLQYSISNILTSQSNKSDIIEQKLKLYTSALLTREANKLDNLDSKIKNADPGRILQMGFTITRVNGKAVKQATELKKGDMLDTEFANGTIKSIVQ